MALLAAGEDARKAGSTSATQDERTRSWRRWGEFLKDIDLHHDPFLSSFTDPSHRTTIICAFAQALRDAQFSPKHITRLAEGSIRTTVDHVAQAFRASDRPDPRLDSEGRVALLLSQQYKGYKNRDANSTQQKALPLSVIQQLHKSTNTVENLAVSQLCTGAFFFAMRSCEYLATPKTEENRRTRTLRLRNLCFRVKGQVVPHSSHNITQADTITITFEFQKSQERHESVTMHRSGDKLLCPVRAWASVTRRILSYPGTSSDTPVNTILLNKTLRQISSTTARNKLRSAAAAIGEKRLGFSKDEIGTHSIRSGSAMAMYLDGVPTFSIMMIGRWSSDAFLRYIRRQVEQFTHNVSRRMLRNPSFFTTPDFDPTVSRHDTRGPQDPHNFATSHFGGVAGRREPFTTRV